MASRLAPSAQRLSRAAALSLAVAALTAGALVALALAAPRAAAQVVHSEGVSAGVQSRSTQWSATSPSGFENPLGNPVVSASRVYAVYWDPGDRYHGDWQQLIDGFLRNLGDASGALSAVFSVDGQYTDAEGGHAAYDTSFGGAYTDTSAYPAAGCTDPQPLVEGDAVTCLTDAQIRAQLQSFIASHSLPTGMGAIYYVLTPPGVTACLGAGGAAGHCSDYEGEPKTANPSYATSFCSYHSYIEGGGEAGGPETVLYGVVPWTAGGLGDVHLAAANRTPAYDCQGGGWEPAPEPAPSFEEQPEKLPTQQEPNQIGLGPDGSYDTGLADLIVSQIAVQQQNIVTDPLLNGWRTSAGLEVTDECRNTFAPKLGGSSGALPGTGAGNLYNQRIGEGDYYLNDAYNLAATQLSYPGVACVHGLALSPSFTTPEVVNAGELVGFDGMESDITLDAGTTYASGKPLTDYPVFEWSFGDGTSVKGYAPGAPPANSPSTSPCELPWVAPCAASAFHSYVYGGTYTVTLKVTDTGGNTATVSRRITVDGPAPPLPPSPPAASTGGAGPAVGGATGGGAPRALVPGAGGGSNPPAPSGSGSKASPSGGKSAKKGGKAGKAGKGGRRRGRKRAAAGGRPLPRPVATALAPSQSLRSALRKGLLVRYSVNQQVAGQFEVLVSRRLARRLRLKGLAAKGLPAGSKPQTVIAQRLLVTMRRAHGRLRIGFPLADLRPLSRLRHLRVTLRLVVRNASRRKPKLTLVTTVVNLRG